MNNGMHLRASAMFYAVTAALLIGAVTGSTVLLDHHHNLRVVRALAREHAKDRALAALHRAPSIGADGAGWSGPLDPFQDQAGEVEVQVRPWGLFEAVSATAIVADRTVVLEGLRGRYLDMTATLYLAPRAGPLHLCGDARVQGTVFLPRADVRRGHIEGRPFTGERFVDGVVRSSATLTRVVDPALRQRVLRTLDAASEPPHPVVRVGRTVNDPGLPAGAWILGGDSLWIGPDCALRNALVTASTILIAPGVSGTMQCFADRRIDVGEEVVLEFPSVLCTIRRAGAADRAPIHLDRGAHVQGTIVALDEAVRGAAEPLVRMAPGTVLDGELVVEGAVDIRGTVHGRVVAGTLAVHTSASFYSDHVLDGRILPPRAPAVAAGLLDVDTGPALLTWTERP